MNSGLSTSLVDLPGWVELVTGPLGGSVIVLSGTFTVLHADANACRVLGMATTQDVQSSWHEIAPELTPEAIAALLADANPCRFDLVRGSGAACRRIGMEIHRSDAWAGGVIFLRELEDFADLNMVMAMQLRNQRQVISGLLHELNGPLNAIRLTLELLSRTLAAASPDAGAPSRAGEFIDVLREESNRLGRAAQRLPLFLDATPGVRRDADLRELVTDVVQLLGHHQRMRRIRWTLELPDGPVVFHGNHRQLREAIVCLAIYAMEGMPPGSEFSTAMKVDAPHVELIFVDTGPVITPHQMRELDQLYPPPHPATPDLHGVRRVVEANHGEFMVANEPERGRRFTVRLPLRA